MLGCFSIAETDTDPKSFIKILLGGLENGDDALELNT